MHIFDKLEVTCVGDEMHNDIIYILFRHTESSHPVFELIAKSRKDSSHRWIFQGGDGIGKTMARKINAIARARTLDKRNQKIDDLIFHLTQSRSNQIFFKKLIKDLKGLMNS